MPALNRRLARPPPDLQWASAGLVGLAAAEKTCETWTSFLTGCARSRLLPASRRRRRAETARATIGMPAVVVEVSVHLGGPRCLGSRHGPRCRCGFWQLLQPLQLCASRSGQAALQLRGLTGPAIPPSPGPPSLPSACKQAWQPRLYFYLYLHTHAITMAALLSVGPACLQPWILLGRRQQAEDLSYFSLGLGRIQPAQQWPVLGVELTAAAPPPWLHPRTASTACLRIAALPFARPPPPQMPRNAPVG